MLGLAEGPMLPGMRLATTLGPFSVVRLLGQGGMGAAFEALDPATGRKVISKVVTTGPHDGGTWSMRSAT